MTPIIGETKVPEADSNASVANAMNAVALVVAVVALILTLGTTWLSKQMVRIQGLESQLRGQIGLGELREQAADALLGAKDALLRWAAGQAEDPAARVAEWAIWLEMLMSPDVRSRFNAFGELQVLNVMPKRLRLPVATYASFCDALAQLRMEQRTSFGSKADKPTGQVDEGRWCRLFDEEEQARFEKVVMAVSHS